MIKPTIGRVVWYYPDSEDLAKGMVQYAPRTPLDAHVVHVWNDNCINLVIFDNEGSLWKRTSVAINIGPREASAYAEWMPYQISQAKKYEEENKQ